MTKCKLCNQQVVFVVDKAKEPVKWKMPRESHVGWNFSWPSVPHPSGLCYYHLKVEQKLFDTRPEQFRHKDKHQFYPL